VRVLKQIAYLLHDLVGVRKGIIVPKANDSVAVALEIFGSSRVAVQHVHVLSAVKLDYQEFFRCAEVSEEWSDRKLSSKFDMSKLSASETTP
jgi:hypothetical protein